MRELPAAFAHHLHQAARHSLEQIAQPQLVTDGFGFLQIGWGGRPAAPQQQVEAKAFGKDMILMKLGGGDYPLPPDRQPQRRLIETVEQ